MAGGLLQVDGSIAHSATTVDGGTLGGSGTVGRVEVVHGALAPGASTGILRTGTIVLNSGVDFLVELGGTAAGTGYDQAAATGAVLLGTATLQVSLIRGFDPHLRDSFTIIDNEGNGAIIGQFAQGASVSVGGTTFSINYAGGDGNDVVLTVTTTPTPENDSITGTDGPDTIAALAGDDVVLGLGAGDILFGNQGDDTLLGGPGNQTLVGGQGNDSVGGGDDNDLLFGNEGSDTIAGGDGDNTIVGGQDSSDAADLITSGSGQRSDLRQWRRRHDRGRRRRQHGDRRVRQRQNRERSDNDIISATRTTTRSTAATART